MIRSRHVWLSPRDLRRDFGPVEGVTREEVGASGRLHYAMPPSWHRLAMLVLAATGAGLAIAAPLSVLKGGLLLLPAIGIGALYVAALRLILSARARDRTLGHHGRFLPTLTRIRVERVRRWPSLAAIRLRRALAARHALEDARDLCAAFLLRAAAPIAAGLWLASGALLPAALCLAALSLGLLAGLLMETSRQSSSFRTDLAKTRFNRIASEFVAIWPTLRSLAPASRAIDRLRRQVPIAVEQRSVRATLRLSALFRLVVPGLAIIALLAAARLPLVAILGMAVAAVAAGQAGAALGVQLSRIADARRRRDTADRLFLPESAPDRTIDRIESIEVQDLGFRYPKAAEPVFRHVSFTLNAGEVLALSSPSGTGKTTLLRVLTALADPCAGQVLVNGDPIRTLAYRHRIAAVFQDEPIGAGTIRAAIAGSAPIDLDAIWAAAVRVGADVLIRELPMEMQTLIVEGPFPPSLLQPLLIARALAQQPDLLILDEALGALPLAQAQALLESLRAEGRLVIFASHDPRVVALADKVLELG